MDNRNIYDKPLLSTDQVRKRDSDVRDETVVHPYESGRSKTTESSSSDTRETLHHLQAKRNQTNDGHTQTNLYTKRSSYLSLANRNSLAEVLLIIGIAVYICGFIGGLILGVIFAEYGDFSFGIAFACWIAALISGTLILSVREVINLLQVIVNNQYFSQLNKASDHFDTSVNRLKELKGLFAAGVITQEEYDMEKNKMMETVNKSM